MLSQIRQISDGNYNTVFVKNKEQKFNLEKEIHDLECWKQSRNHVYRKEERELVAHLDKLHHQQEYLHRLDEERTLHPRAGGQGTGNPHGGHHHRRDSHGNSQPDASVPRHGNDTAETDQGHPSKSSNVSLPPVHDSKTLHRTDAHTNICVVCQLPRRSLTKHGHHSMTGEVCCCEHEGVKEEQREKAGRRLSVGAHEEHGSRHGPIQVGQRRHSLMMARLNDEKYEHKPHPPERSHGGQQHKDHHRILNPQGHVHDSHDHQDHVHDHRGHVHDHRNHVHDHLGHGHDHHSRVHDHHGHHATTHRHGNDAHTHHGNQSADMYHTPSNSPHKSPHHSLSQQGHHNSATPSQDHLHSAAYHSQGRAPGHGTDHATLHSLGGLRTGVQDHQNGEARRRDHELHWDRHQVHKLRGMITDPHYKEQLELEGGRVYPWSSQYQPNKSGSDDVENMKNCRYLRFSKLNLESMKENPEKEVEVFERKKSPP